MLAVAISSAMTAVSGVFFAFYYNNLFPEQIFHISRSIEIILGPIIGGIGTLFGPILGAAVLTLLSDGITELLAALGWEIPGIKQVFYGVVLLVGGDVPAARHLARRSRRRLKLRCLRSATSRSPSAACARCTTRRSRFPRAASTA